MCDCGAELQPGDVGSQVEGGDVEENVSVGLSRTGRRVQVKVGEIGELV